MSEQPQGPGWWLASDGKYYPPQSASGYATAPTPPPQQTKSNVGWWLLGGLVFLFVASIGACGACVAIVGTADDSASTITTSAEEQASEEEPAEAEAETEAEPEATADPPSDDSRADSDATGGTAPEDQTAFVTIIENAREDIRQADNDLRESVILRDRDEDLAALIGQSLEVNNWTGTISQIGANGEGKAYVEIEIADSVRVGTWNNAFSDFDDDTLIPPDNPLFDTLLALDEGSTVVFSGTFFPGSDTALEGKNLTETFYGIDPKFLFRFKAID